MSKSIIRIILGLMVLAVYHTSTAMPRVEHISPTEYRAANKNWAAAQDDHGFTYFGNDMGLLEFDGLQWTLHRLPRASVVRSVAALSHETLFTGSFEEFGRWDRDESGALRYTSLIPTEYALRPRNSDFWKIHITDEGVLFQSFDELYLYDYQTVRKLDTGMNILFLLHAENEMWAQKMGGPIYRFTDGRFTQIPHSELFSNTTVRMLLTLPDAGHFLIGTGTNGLWVYDGTRFREWNSELSALMKRYELNCGIRTSRGTYMLGTILNGIYEVDVNGRILRHLSTDNLLINNTVMSLFEDDSHNVWSMSDRGLAYLSYKDGIDYHTDPRWPFGSVYDAVMWQDKLFIGTNQGVFYASADLHSGSDLRSDFRRVAGIQGQVWSFSVLDGRLLCCHNSGVLEINRDFSVRKISDMGGYQLNRTRVYGRDLTFFASYFRLRTLDLTTGAMSEIGDLPESFYHVEVDHMQNVWLEHPTKGVYRCRLSEDLRKMNGIKLYGGDSDDGLPYKMQVFRVGGRVALMGGDRFFTYNDIQDHIEPDSVLNTCFAGVHGLRRVVAMGHDRFWVIASAGAYQLQYDGYTASRHACRGIPAGNMVYGYEHVAMLNDTTSLFCCDNGFIVHRRHSADSYRPAVPTIESVGAGADAASCSYFASDKTARIPYQDNSVVFRFAVRRAFAEQLAFKYRLQGVDAAWNKHNTTGEALYARLPKGHYTFEVAAEDRFGNSSEPMLMNIEILAPWYTSAWAYAGYTLLSMLLLYSTWVVIMYRYRRNYLRRLRHREIIALRTANKELNQELEIRDAEIFSQSSMLIAKNEQITKIRDMVDDFHRKQDSKILTPLYYKINTFIENNLDTDNDWRLFLIKFEHKHTGFFRILKDRYPELTSNDLRLCACLKLHLDSKEIASLMNLTVRAVENSRYRLRKKLGLQSSQNLNDFLMEVETESANSDISESENQ